MGELDLDKIERLLEPEWEPERPRPRRPIVRVQEIIDETKPSQRDDDECLAIARR
jgi:hypothetical protein